VSGDANTFATARLGWALLLWAALAAPAAGGPDKPREPFNVDVSFGWGGCCRPMEWTPVEINITPNLKKPFQGTLTFSAPQDALTTMRIWRDVALTPGFPQRVPLVTKFAFSADECRLTLRDDRTRLYRSYRYPIWSGGYGRTASVQVRTGDVLIGAAGRCGFGLLRLPRRSRCPPREPGSGRPGQVYVRTKLPRLLPVDWTGYASLDLLVLYDVDLSELSAHQASAIAQWVRGGGRLLLVLGKNVLPGDSPVTGLLPFRPGSPRRFRVSTSRLRQWGCEPGRKKLDSALTCWGLPADPGEGWRTVRCPGSLGPPASAPAGRAHRAAAGRVDLPVFAHGPAGFGSVGVVAFDPAVVGGRQAENLARFWIDRVDPLLHGRRIEYDPDPADDDAYSGGSFELGRAGIAVNAVLEHLHMIPELRPLSIWVVVGLLLALAVLVGPVDYLLLKRLDKLPLTWVTSTAWLVLFSVGAYYGVRALRSGAAQVRAVSVIDGIDGVEGAWRTVYAGIFAPISDEYRLTDVSKTGWFASVTASEGSQLYAWSQRGPTREVVCRQRDGGNRPTSLPINIWSMQCLLAESPADEMPFSAVVRRRGGRVSVTVKNRAGAGIANGCVRLQGDRVMRFGRVGAGKTRTFDGRAGSERPWHARVDDLRRRQEAYHEPPLLSEGGFTGDEAYFARGCERRTHAVLARLARGDAVVCVRYDAAPAPFALQRAGGTYDHVQMARLLVSVREGNAP